MNPKKYIVNRLIRIKPGSRAGRVANGFERILVGKYTETNRVLLIARIQAERGDTETAIRTLSSGIKENPESTQLRFRKAFLLEKSGELAEAREIYETLVGLPDSDPILTYRLSVTSSGIGDDEAALSWALNYFDSNPEDSKANLLAYRLAAREPIWRRFEILYNARGDLRENAEWQSDLITLAYKLKRFDVCVDRYKSIKQNLNRSAVSKVVASLFRLGRTEEARLLALTNLSMQKGTKTATFPGELLSEIGEWKLAAEMHELDYSKRPDGEVAYLAGFASSRLFEWERAANWYRVAIPDSRNRKRVRFDLALALERQGRWTAAAREYLSASLTSSINDYRRYRAIYCLYKIGDIESAFTILDSLDWKEQDGQADALLPIFSSDELEKQLRLQMEEAKCKQHTAGLRYIATEALSFKMWRLAVDACVALVERESVHQAQNYLLLSRAYSSQGLQREAIEAFLESRIHQESSIVSSSDYEKSPGVRRAMRYGSFHRTRPFAPQTVLFESNHGSKLTCNILPLVSAFVEDRRFEKWKIYVALADRGLLPPQLVDNARIITVPRESDLYLRILSSAAWVVNNNTFPPYYARPAQQRYLNTWHGTPIKSMGHEIKSGNFDHKNAARNFLHITDFALPNAHTRDQLLNKYDVSSVFDGRIEMTGSPRMDLTASLGADDIRKVRRRLGVPEGATAVLYAPTWRGELGNVTSHESRVRSTIESIQEVGYYGLYRGHPVSESVESSDSLDLPMVPDDIDTNVLLACIDVVITDYSSIAFDAALAGLKVVLYAYDEAEYTEVRGLSLSLAETGFPVVASGLELRDWLSTLERQSRPDLADSFSEHEDGMATERVLSIMSNLYESDPVEKPNRNVLIFEGHFIPNGITSAARELNRVVNGSDCNLMIVVEPSAITPYEDRVTAFENAALNCEVLPRISGSLESAEQRWLISRQHEGMDLSPAQLEDIHEAYRLEFVRLFGHHCFEAVIGFEGFSLYWANLMGASNAYRRIAYLHADMVGEASSRFPYLWSVFDAYKHYDYLASVSSDANEENSRKLEQWTNKEQFVVAENIINVEEIQNKATVSVPQDYEEFTSSFDHVFVAVGRVSIEKGSDRLIDAFIRAADIDTRIGLVVIGDGPLALQLKNRIRISGHEDRVYFTGHLPSPYSHMSRCDSLVLSSLHEGQGIVVLEALVLGLKVVSVDIPGPRSLLGGGAGLLVANTTEGLFEGMITVAEGYAPQVEFDATQYLELAIEHAKSVFSLNRTESMPENEHTREGRNL